MTEAGAAGSLDAVAAPIINGAGTVDVPLADELLRFASAAAGFDSSELASARQALVAVAGEAFMVDAAAVIANFEMMTRVADGTGARFPTDPAAIGGSAAWVSHR